MIFYRTRQSWLPRKLFPWNPETWFFAYAMTNNELVTQACLAASPTPLPTPQKTGSKKYFKSQADNWKMSCLSLWI